MAGELASFFVLLGTVFDGSGLKQANASFKETGETADKLAGGLKGIAATVAGGAAIWKLIDFSVASLEAFGQQERAERRLELAMQNLGVYTKRAHTEMVAFAEGIQKVTTFQDDAIIETQALLTTFGLYGDQLKQVTQAAADLSSGLGIDLHAATMLLGKAFTGETAALGRYGMQIKDTGRVADNFGQVMDLVQKRFAGAAAAEAETYLGKIKMLTNNFGELKERIGKELLPVANAWLSWTNRAITAAQDLMGAEDDGLKGKQLTIRALKDEANAIAMRLAPMEQYQTKEALAQDEGYVKDKARLDLIFKRIKAEEDLQAKVLAREGEGAKGGPTPNRRPEVFTDAEEKTREKTSLEAKRMIDEAEFNEAEAGERSKIRKIQETEFKLMQEGKYSQASLLRSTALHKAEEQLNKRRLVNVADTLGTIATLSTSNNKTLAAIGKAAALSQATIDTYLGVGKAWALGPIIGPPLAAMVLVAGLANVAKIAGVPLKKGGVATATPGGIMANIAEGGEDEVVAPLNEEAGRRLGIRNGGAGSTLIMHQTNYFGGEASGKNEQSLEEMAERLRLATRDGVGEMVDLAKEIYETGKARAGEA